MLEKITFVSKRALQSGDDTRVSCLTWWWGQNKNNPLCDNRRTGQTGSDVYLCSTNTLWCLANILLTSHLPEVQVFSDWPTRCRNTEKKYSNVLFKVLQSVQVQTKSFIVIIMIFSFIACRSTNRSAVDRSGCCGNHSSVLLEGVPRVWPCSGCQSPDQVRDLIWLPWKQINVQSTHLSHFLFYFISLVTVILTDDINLLFMFLFYVYCVTALCTHTHAVCNN